jgi:hypothetical protein
VGLCVLKYFECVVFIYRAWGSVVVKALRYKSEGTGIDSRCRRGFSVASDCSMCPGVDLASKNEYQVNPGVKAAGA